jgi:hypothetical protein
MRKPCKSDACRIATIIRRQAFLCLSVIVVLSIHTVATAATTQRIEVLQGGVLKGVIDPYVGSLTSIAN